MKEERQVTEEVVQERRDGPAVREAEEAVDVLLVLWVVGVGEDGPGCVLVPGGQVAGGGSRRVVT